VANEGSPGSPLAGPIELAGVNVDFSGTERLDRSWVAAAYPPNAPGPAAREGKREVRQFLRTPPARLVMQDYSLAPGEARAWLLRRVPFLLFSPFLQPSFLLSSFCTPAGASTTLVPAQCTAVPHACKDLQFEGFYHRDACARRFRLPQSLPPSFKGVAARYAYALAASAQFALPKQAAAAAAAAAAAPGAPPADEDTPAASAHPAADGAPSSSSAAAAEIVGAELQPDMRALSLRGIASSSNERAPSDWQTAETSAAVHLWPYWVRPHEGLLGCAAGILHEADIQAMPLLPPMMSASSHESLHYASSDVRCQCMFVSSGIALSRHLLPDQDPSDRRGSAGAVSAGEDAELAPIPYSLSYAARELSVDFQASSFGSLSTVQISCHLRLGPWHRGRGGIVAWNVCREREREREICISISIYTSHHLCSCVLGNRS
jgi:hypothetical protein